MKNKIRIKLLGAIAALTLVFTSTQSLSAADSYYPEDSMHLFRPYPKDVGRGSKAPWRVRYFGPVGIGIDLKRPGMTMEITNVEKGSPADKTGQVRVAPRIP